MQSATIIVKQFATPLGPMYGGACEAGICFLEFIKDEEAAEVLLQRLSRELNAVMQFGEHHHLLQLEQELSEYFLKTRTEFSVPLHLGGTDFQQSVWSMLLQIPYGRTWTYKQQALALENLLGIRAIASANGQNRHAIIIPCHRVIGSNGKLTGYAGGLPKKEWLLKHEGAHSPQLFDQLM